MEWNPGVSTVVSVATPALFTVATPSLPGVSGPSTSVKTTLPCGTGAPEVVVTVAVNLTGAPASDGLPDVVAVTCVPMPGPIVVSTTSLPLPPEYDTEKICGCPPFVGNEISCAPSGLFKNVPKIGDGPLLWMIVNLVPGGNKVARDVMISEVLPRTTLPLTLRESKSVAVFSTSM